MVVVVIYLLMLENDERGQVQRVWPAAPTLL